MKDLRICITATVFLLTLSLAPILEAQDRIPAKDSSQAELHSLIETAMMQWEVPGLAIVVVKGDKTVLLQGYGTRVLGQSLDIDADTYLQIASNSKLFTAYVIGMLVDEGRLSWHDPVKKHIPEFELSDPYVAGY